MRSAEWRPMLDAGCWRFDEPAAVELRSADFPVRSNFRRPARSEQVESHPQFESCCGLESPRSEVVPMVDDELIGQLDLMTEH
jgi:hypothetical protein